MISCNSYFHNEGRAVYGMARGINGSIKEISLTVKIIIICKKKKKSVNGEGAGRVSTLGNNGLKRLSIKQGKRHKHRFF